MKNFFKNLFKKKYPERVEEKRVRTGRVYAGPEQMRARKSMKCVYAGPPDTVRRVMDSEMEDVYAGPPDSYEPIEEENDI